MTQKRNEEVAPTREEKVLVEFRVPYGGYNTGEEAAFPASQAMPLLVEDKDGNSIARYVKGKVPDEALKKVVQEEAPSEDQIEHDAKIGRLVELIDGMDPGNPDYWGEGGVPRVNGLSGLYGERVTAAERDEAWQRLVVLKSGNDG